MHNLGKRRHLSALFMISTARRACVSAFMVAGAAHPYWTVSSAVSNSQTGKVSPSGLRPQRSSCRLASSSSSSSGTRANKVVQDALYRIRDVNFLPLEVRDALLPFQLDGVRLGKVPPATAQVLVDTQPYGTPVFEFVNDKQELTLSSACGSTPEERSAAVAAVLETLRDQGLIPGWRDELYPVAPRFDHTPFFVMERAAVALLGILEYGVHINGLVDDGNGQEQMWMARRSATKSKYPGMLDHIVAGGQPEGISLVDNCVKECLEEAGIPEDLARPGLVPTGAISYETHLPKKKPAVHLESLSRTILFCFDLPLPASFVPTPVDGEVQEFFLWNVEQLLDSLAPDYRDPIKPNCYVVIIDWLIRKGHLSPDVPGYLDVLRELRSGACQ